MKGDIRGNTSCAKGKRRKFSCNFFPWCWVTEAMTNSLCRLFRYSQPSSSEVDDLFWSYIANSIFIFSSVSIVMMNNATAKAIENIAAESHCFWSLRWFSASAIIYRFPGYVVTTSNSKLRNVLCFYNDHDWFHCFIIFICHRNNCRRIPGCSSSSQIPGTCDSQTSCYCGYLNMNFLVFCYHCWPFGVYEMLL